MMTLAASLSRLLKVALLLPLLPGGVSGWAQTAPGPWSMTGYVQQSWPKQTETNRQIKDINASFGSAFKTWDDVANLNIGLQLFRDLDPHWKVGVELDYSRGKLRGTTTVNTLAGPAALAFEQKFSVFADLLGVVQYRPLGTAGQWTPFVLAGAGVAYEKDRTLLTLRNDYLDEGLRVDNSGWFPMFTLGLGVDVYLTAERRWYAEVGLGYTWNRLKHTAPAKGSLAPTPTVTADTDSTGPNAWLGIGRRF